MEKQIFGKPTTATLLSTWRGMTVEVRQKDILSGENIVMLDEETILKLAEMIKKSK